MHSADRCRLCDRPRHAHGLCRLHYMRQYRAKAERPPLPCGDCGVCMRCMGRKGGLKRGATRVDEKKRVASAKVAARAKADPEFRAALFEERLDRSKSAWVRRKARAAKTALARARREKDAKGEEA